jgi:hypothetical protein
MVNRVTVQATIISGILFTGTLYAQVGTVPLNSSDNSFGCVDTDGDGWGWTGTESCMVQGFVPMEGECIDYDGDGWGWNGVASCRIEGFVATAGTCVDTDNDGYGWDGVATCFIDSDSSSPTAGDGQVVDGGNTDAAGDSGTGQDGDTETARLAFVEQLEGIRSYGCSPGEEGQFTTEFVEIYANGQTTYDFWLYEEPDCVTRPLTFTSTLPIDGFVIEDPVPIADGRGAFGIRLETIQQSSEADESDSPVGTVLFDLVAVEQGGVTTGDTLASTTPEGRPTALGAPFNADPIGMRAAPASREGLMRSWSASCFNGREQQRVFDEQQLVETISFYADDDCSADMFLATRVNTWSIDYGDAVVTTFGQSALRTSTVLIDSQYTSLVIDSTLGAPPPLSQVGLMFEDIWAVIDNELVIGTCLDKRPANCGVGENIPDLLNFNVGNRFVGQ